MNTDAIKAFVKCLAHREQVEVGATVQTRGTTTEVCYATQLEWPWPRQFPYRSEFFCIGLGTSCLDEVRSMSGSMGEHVVNFFSRELETEAQHFIDAGYVQAWVSVLLGRSLSQKWNRPLHNELEVREVVSDQDMARFASLPGISNQGATRDPCIHNFFATAGGEVAAKGQLVLLPGSGAYISDMFSKPEHRLRGLCTAILAALERKALSLGATHVCLAPGFEVAAFGLYEKYGYTAVGSRAVLILSERNASAA